MPGGSEPAGRALWAAMNAAVVRRTQESLGRVIRKPPLTDRLLCKPPFRYLHDVIGEVGLFAPSSRPRCQVIRVTGFMKGLYTDFEMKSDNVKDKDARISFLQKAIDVVIMVTGEPLAVKPVRIVAGHEPEKTNEFLQAIGKCCLNKLSSDDAVKRVLAGEKADIKGKTPSSSKFQDKENRESRAEEQKSHKDKESRGDSEIKDRSTSRERKPREELKDGESRQREKESDKHKDNDRRAGLERDNIKEGEKHERDAHKNRTAKQGRETEKSRDKEKGNTEREKDLDHDKGRERDRKNDGGREKDRTKVRDKGREKGLNREKDREKQERGKDGERSREQGKDKAEKKSTESEETRARKTKDTKNEPNNESESLARLSRQHSTKGSRHRSKPGGEGTSLELIRSPPSVRRKDSKSSTTRDSPEKKSSSSHMKGHGRKDTVEKQLGVLETNSTTDHVSDETAASVFREKAEPGAAIKQQEGEAGNISSEKPMVSDNGEVSNDLPPHATQRMPRPSSARPAPPRIKRQESTEILLPERSGSGKTVSNVIIDKQNSDDDDDQFVVEATPQLPEMPEMEMEPAVELDGEEKHGGLVKRILETKKDYETSQKSLNSSEKEKPFLSEAARRKEKDLVSKEIEKFRGSIQTLCRSALPLGKIMDYIQEDMDAMKNELQMWQHENKQHAEALQKEQKITDSAVEPLKAELAELEQLIKDQQDKICAVKANILKKEEKIQKMVLSINLSSRR
ncbi:TRAF3-interacting protein 1 isoform X2 [Alligator mississippiensis]|uniref:TRAF3-interacting protein 1 isoform X2 n=1 Tax=Alligator mississippiensis TaxID=8496 RepID=UPI002877E4F8|nr:TRAF3-interacting protein 1 isoform X2 [Alligator mississippiensis]